MSLKQDPFEREQLRFAVVLNGGVSLAVWMGGAVHELDRLTHRAGGVYSTLLDWAMSEARVDVISGTSAGGINGAALALRQVNVAPSAPDLGVLRDVWLDSGSLQDLLRQPFRGSPPSLLKGDEFFLPELRRALRLLATPYQSGSPIDGNDRPMDLTITTTLLRGVPGVVVDDAGQVVTQTRHDGLFRFRRGPTHPGTTGTTPIDDFANDAMAIDNGGVLDALALAARTTASYPVAFEPSFLWTGQEEAKAGSDADPVNVDAFLSGAWDGSQDGTRRARFGVDGGVLANTPTRPAMEAVDAMPASGLVRRALLLVHPHAPPATADKDDRITEPPSLVRTGASLLKALTSEGSRNFVDLVEEHNRTAGRRREMRLEVVLRAVADGGGTPPDRLNSQAECVYSLYRQLRLHQASRELAEIWLSALPRSGTQRVPRRGRETLSFVMGQALRLLRQRPPVQGADVTGDSGQQPVDGDVMVPPDMAGLPAASALGFEGAVGVADAAVDFLRRAMWAVAADERAARQVASARKTVSGARIEILRLQRDYYSKLHQQAVQLRTADEEEAARRDEPPTDEEQAPARKDEPPPDRDPLSDPNHPLARWVRAAKAYRPEREPEQLNTQLVEIAGAVSRALSPRTRGASGTQEDNDGAVAFAAFAEVLAGDDYSNADEVLERLSAVQLITYVVACESKTGNALPLGLIQLTYQVRHPFAPQLTTGEDKVAGDMMARFSGFLKRAWRLNDWTWGRLDAARVLCETVLEPKRVRRYLKHRQATEGDDAISHMVHELLYLALSPSKYQTAREEAEGAEPPQPVANSLPPLLGLEQDRAELGLPNVSALQAELKGVLKDTSESPPHLALVPQVFAAALALEVASDELPALPRAVKHDLESGADPRSRSAVYVTHATAIFDAASNRDEPTAGWTALQHFAAARLGREPLSTEAGSDQMIQTAATAVATGVTMLDGERSGLAAFKPLTRTLRGGALLPYWVVRGLTGGNAVAQSLAQLTLALGGVLAVLGLLGVAGTWATTAGVGLLLVAFAYGALRSGTLLHGVVLLVPALVVLALLLPGLADNGPPDDRANEAAGQTDETEPSDDDAAGSTDDSDPAPEAVADDVDASADADEERRAASSAVVIAALVLIVGLFVLGSLSPPVLGPFAWLRQWSRAHPIWTGVAVAVAAGIFVVLLSEKVREWLGRLGPLLAKTARIPDLLGDAPWVSLGVAAGIVLIGSWVANRCSRNLELVVWDDSPPNARWATRPGQDPASATAAWAVVYGAATGLLAATVWVWPGEPSVRRGLVGLALAVGALLLVVGVPLWLNGRVRRRLRRAAETAFVSARAADSAEGVHALFNAGLNRRYLLELPTGGAAQQPDFGDFGLTDAADDALADANA
jgi:patatin-related protein